MYSYFSLTGKKPMVSFMFYNFVPFLFLLFGLKTDSVDLVVMQLLK